MSVTFGSSDSAVEAVERRSLNVQPGEFVSLIGPSGCGKSTLLSIVAGFVKPTRGEAMLDGKPITSPARTAAWCSSNTRCFHGSRSARTSSSG